MYPYRVDDMDVVVGNVYCQVLALVKMFHQPGRSNGHRGSQWHEANKQLRSKIRKIQTFFQFFGPPTPVPRGGTDLMDMHHGIDGLDHASLDLPADIKKKLMVMLSRPEMLQNDRINLIIFLMILRAAGVDYNITHDLFVRMDDGYTTRTRLGLERRVAKSSSRKNKSVLRFLDGTAATSPSQYVERSSMTSAKEEEMALWRTWIHNEFAILAFYNLILNACSPDTPFHDVLALDYEAMYQARKNWKCFKVWIIFTVRI